MWVLLHAHVTHMHPCECVGGAWCSIDTHSIHTYMGVLMTCFEVMITLELCQWFSHQYLSMPSSCCYGALPPTCNTDWCEVCVCTYGCVYNKLTTCLNLAAVRHASSMVACYVVCFVHMEGHNNSSNVTES